MALLLLSEGASAPGRPPTAVYNSQGIKTLYDKYEEATLWGRDLVEHVEMVYRRGGRYCVIFISKHTCKRSGNGTSDDPR